MKEHDLEDNIISCILQKNELINELYVDDIVFQNPINNQMVKFFKKFYQENKTLDLTLMLNKINNTKSQSKLMEYVMNVMLLVPTTSLFYEYQDQLQEKYKAKVIESLIDSYKTQKITKDELIEKIIDIQNQNLIISNNHKKISPKEMLNKIRNKDKIIKFNRLWRLGTKLNIKTNTVNVIAARPSEGKSALALNLFLDLSKNYKTLYFNLEMTESEIYERMVGIESNLPIETIKNPETQNQENMINTAVNQIYNLNYEVVNGSKTLKSIKSKIIKEQREEHLIVFIDYVGYIKNKPNQNDRERIGEIVREINDITKDYKCTIFLVAQINRTGSEIPTMQDLKDSGELEQTADTIILIHDEHPEVPNIVKDIKLLIPKCRGGKRNIYIQTRYDKSRQRMEVFD